MRKTLLLIEEDRNLLDLNRKILAREGYDVCCSTNFAQARRVLETMTPDGIIMNIQMPDGSGLDFCRELREKTRTPILFLSGSRDDELAALHAGGNDFMREPYDIEILKARILVMLQKKSETDEKVSENDLEKA